MIDAICIEERCAALDAVDDVSLVQEEFSEVCAVLAGDAGDEGDLGGLFGHLVLNEFVGGNFSSDCTGLICEIRDCDISSGRSDQQKLTARHAVAPSVLVGVASQSDRSLCRGKAICRRP